MRQASRVSSRVSSKLLAAANRTGELNLREPALGARSKRWPISLETIKKRPRRRSRGRGSSVTAGDLGDVIETLPLMNFSKQQRSDLLQPLASSTPKKCDTKDDREHGVKQNNSARNLPRLMQARPSKLGSFRANGSRKVGLFLTLASRATGNFSAMQHMHGRTWSLQRKTFVEARHGVPSCDPGGSARQCKSPSTARPGSRPVAPRWCRYPELLTDLENAARPRLATVGCAPQRLA